MRLPTYKILFTLQIPEMQGLWDGAFWRKAQPLFVGCFRPEGSDHRPRTFCKLFYNEQNIFGIFRVEDQYVRCIHPRFQSDVWKDSCVEFFVRPKNGEGYFNFEFNCGGALLAAYVTDPTRAGCSLKKYIPLTPDDDQQIQRYASLTPIVEPEITKPVVWTLEFSIPLIVLEKYVGQIGTLKEKIWHANFYKCGNETSRPHWASWTPLSARNFHDPSSFGQIEFCQ
jgi:hypothetical protein